MIIRSHEGPDARADREDMGNMLSGYSADHEVESGKLYTIFSASMFSQVIFLNTRTTNRICSVACFSNWFLLFSSFAF